MRTTHKWLVAGGVLAGVLCGAALTFAADSSARGVPDFSANEVSWEGVGMEFLAPPSGPGPVISDKDHPYISNQVALTTGKQPTFPVSYLSNPILKPCAVPQLRKLIDARL